MQQVENTVQSALVKAKTGDPQALKQLMSGPLKRKGIDVSVERKGALIFICLSGQPCPPKQGSLRYVRQGLQKLEIEGIESVRLSGYKADQLNPQWVERIPLQTSSSQPAALATTASHSPSPAPSNSGLKKSLLVLGGLLLALVILGLIVRGITHQSPRPTEPQPEQLSDSPAE